MNKLDKLSLDIENLRQEMHDLIEKEQYLISPEIIIMSQKLDELIVEYDIIKLEMLYLPIRRRVIIDLIICIEGRISNLS